MMLTYHEYARTILDDENYNKFSGFIDRVFSNKPIGTVYFYGAGGNGKSTLIRYLIDSFPSMFGHHMVRPGTVSIYDDGLRPTKLPGADEGSVIIVTNALPDGVHPNHIIFFKDYVR